MPKDSDALVDRYLAISRAIAGQLDFQSVLSQVALQVDSLFQPDHMDVAIILPDRRDCCVAFEVGVHTKWGSTESQLIEVSPVRSLLLGEVPHLITDDAWEDDRFHFNGAFDSPIFDAKLHSRLHVPLHVHGVIHGSLNISSHQKARYTDDDVVAAQQVADLLAPYFYALIRGDQAQKAALAEGAARGREEALRLGALRLTEGMEKERRRLGMDLHDQTLADLTRVSRHASRICRQRVPAAAEIAELRDEISTCISELRRIIEDTRPGVMELFGFMQAVEAQLERSVAGIVPKISTEVHDGTHSLLDSEPESLRTTLFRIVQEAINNAVRHGAPSRLTVDIDVDEYFLRIEVVDNGSGIYTDGDRKVSGLDNMRVRAALISAEIEVSRGPENRGTRVAVRVPRRELAAGETDAEDSAGRGIGARSVFDHATNQPWGQK
jgi:signal transduction histidine kinase